MSITYQHDRKNKCHKVYLGGRKTGIIKILNPGFQYVPAGCKSGGIIYDTLIECQKSIGNSPADRNREPCESSRRDTKAEQPLLTFK